MKSLSDIVINADLTVDTNTLYVDSTNNRVGIGTTSPAYKLDVDGDIQINETLIAKSGADLILQARSSQVVGINSNGTRTMTLDASNNVGIGTSSPSQKLTVAGNITQTSNSNYIATRKILARDGNGLDLTDDSGGNGILIKDGGNVIINAGDLGIGTNSPARSIHVKKTGDNEVARFESDQTTSYIELEDANTTGQILIGTQGDNFKVHTGGSERLRIDGSGNVGIRNSSPSTDLEIGDSSGNAAITINKSTSGTGTLYFDNAGSNKVYLQADSGEHLRIATNNTERIRVTDGGNVLIGTTTDNGYKLDVNGTARVNGNLHLDSVGDFITFYGNENADHSISSRDINGATADDLRINSYGSVFVNLDSNSNNTDAAFLIGEHGGSAGTITERFRVQDDGNVGIGTSNPNVIASSVATLSLGGTHTTASGGVSYQVNGSVKFYQYVDTDSLFVHQGQSGIGQKFKVNNSEAMRITSGGNVLIGTTTDSGYRLSVDGDSASGVVRIKNAANARDTFRSENAAGTRTFNIGNDASGHGIVLVRNSSGTTTTYISGSGNSYFNGGYVGIGTMSPARPIHVSSAATSIIADFEYTAAAYSTIKLTNTGGNASVSSLNSDLLLSPGATERMRVKNNGNVLIGTTTDSGYRLDVNGSIHAEYAYVDNWIYHTGDTDTRIEFSNNRIKLLAAGATKIDTDLSYMYQGSFAAAYTGDMDSLTGFRIIRSTAGTNRAFIGHHNVLQMPNTSASSYVAQLAFETGSTANGGIKYRNNAGGTFTDWYTVYNQATDLIPAADSTYDVGSSSVRFANGYFDTLYGDGSNLTGITETDTLDSVTDRGATTTNSITASGMMLGNVHGVSGYYGIKNSSVANSGYAVLQHTGGYTLLNCGSGSVLDFRVGNSQAMRLSSGKNLLIGTTTDSGYKLDVNGDINASGDYYHNGTQGYTGNVTIQQPSPNPPITLEINGGIITNVT